MRSLLLVRLVIPFKDAASNVNQRSHDNEALLHYAFGRMRVLDHVKLRIARLSLHRYFEQLCIIFKKDRKLCNFSQGKGVASAAKDVVLETIYGCHENTVTPEIRKKQEKSFKWNKRIGKRWSYVASHLGEGITLTCSPSLEAIM
jgi:hypothetical protein